MGKYIPNGKNYGDSIVAFNRIWANQFEILKIGQGSRGRYVPESMYGPILNRFARALTAPRGGPLRGRRVAEVAEDAGEAKPSLPLATALNNLACVHRRFPFALSIQRFEHISQKPEVVRYMNHMIIFLAFS